MKASDWDHLRTNLLDRTLLERVPIAVVFEWCVLPVSQSECLHLLIGTPAQPDLLEKLAHLFECPLITEAVEGGMLAEIIAYQYGETFAEVENCAPRFRFLCPKSWHDLEYTEDPDVRFCGVCSQSVFYCRTEAEFISHAEAGHCVANGFLHSVGGVGLPVLPGQ